MLMTQSMAEVNSMLLRQLGSIFPLCDKEKNEIDLNMIQTMKRMRAPICRTGIPL